MLFFKCENFQKIGAFKARGATNAVFSLDDATAQRGVATHSSGNHGAAVARAAKLRGIPAHIVMPSNSAKVKVRAVESYGAQIVFCEPTEEAREAACADVIKKTGAILIHSFENKDVIAGRGRPRWNCSKISPISILMCPVGGGGLLAARRSRRKHAPKHQRDRRRTRDAEDTARSFRAGHIRRKRNSRSPTDCEQMSARQTSPSSSVTWTTS